MTIDELAEITTSATVDKWDATTTIGRSSPPKIYLFFAHTDRWIAPSTRHRIVRAAARASDVEGKGTVAVHVDEEEGVVHGFCIRKFQVFVYISPSLFHVLCLVFVSVFCSTLPFPAVRCGWSLSLFLFFCTAP